MALMRESLPYNSQISSSQGGDITSHICNTKNSCTGSLNDAVGGRMISHLNHAISKPDPKDPRGHVQEDSCFNVVEFE